MNTLFVILPKSECETLKASDHRGSQTIRAAVEQEYYDLYGAESAVRLLRFMVWIELCLASFSHLIKDKVVRSN